jgi:23S rRNA pseudouridine1911/1915/1917 synthase
MEVIYEDNHVLVLIKPYNVPSQADSSKDLDLLTMAKKYLVEKYHKPGDAYVGLVSRLDRPAGGLMVLAKTSKAAQRLTLSFAKHEITKIYLAVVQNNDLKEKDSFTDYLLKDPKTNTVKAFNKEVKGSKLAKLDYTILETKDDLSLVKINLHTGRPHQIRVQFASRGHYLYGDQRYNPKAHPGQQLALWSSYLSFTHPVTKEVLQFTSLPDTGIFKTFAYLKNPS